MNHLIIDQKSEFPTADWTSGHFSYRCAFARSGESAAEGEPGQDYLSLREDGRRLVFTLCDGVSQSFYGNLAGRFLGSQVLTWLWERPCSVASFQNLMNELGDYVNLLTGLARQMVNEQPLPAGLPRMVSSVLEKKRLLGSESMLAAGLVDFDLSAAILVWSGDSRLRCWRKGIEVTEGFTGTFNTHERWSSHKGLVGSLHHFSCPAEEVTVIAAYSDGMARMDGVVCPWELSADTIDEMIRTAPEDDISFLEVRCSP